MINRRSYAQKEDRNLFVDVYHVNNAIKLGQYNVGREGEVLTIPLYMGFLVKDKLADVIIPDIDLSLLTTS